MAQHLALGIWTLIINCQKRTLLHLETALSPTKMSSHACYLLDNASQWRNWSFFFWELYFLCLCEFLFSYMSKILLPQKIECLAVDFFPLASTVNTTFTLPVSGFESADLALKFKVLTGASLSAVRGNRLLCSQDKSSFLWNVKLECAA